MFEVGSKGYSYQAIDPAKPSGRLHGLIGIQLDRSREKELVRPLTDVPLTWRRGVFLSNVITGTARDFELPSVA